MRWGNGEGEVGPAGLRTRPRSAILAATAAAETRPPLDDKIFVQRSGSDDMMDVIKNLGIEYIAAMPDQRFVACMNPTSTMAGIRSLNC